jgi:PAT family beta-lactamase induction signal transducer AmpG
VYTHDFIFLFVVAKLFCDASIVCIENFCVDMGSAAYLALNMSLCDKRYTALFVGPLAAVMVKQLGWADFFVASVIFSLPGIMLLFWFKKPINKFYQVT